MYKATFSLAMANSGMNPMIYAWKNPALRRVFALLMRGRNPDHVYDDAWPTAATVGGESKRQRRRRMALAQQSFENSDARDADAKATAVAEPGAAPAAPPTVAKEEHVWVEQTTDAENCTTTVGRSCCELDSCVRQHNARMWPSYCGEHQRLMDILHIDALVQLERAARVTGWKTTSATDDHKWMNHRVSNRI